MLQVNHLSKSYGIQTVLDDASFVLNRNDRAALIGPNGCGKTTLLRIIAGLEPPDGGAVSIGSGLAIGYLPQGFDLPPDQTIAEAVRSGAPGHEDARQEVVRLEAAMSDASGQMLAGILAQYDAALSRFEALGGYALDHRCEQVIAHLGLGDLDPGLPVERLSGGQKTRLGLARLLVAGPDILLLDEPTNHLDIAALEWLETFLAAYPGAVLVVSHDRVFLDNTVTRILELDARTHRLTAYTGSYSNYAREKEQAIARQWASWADEQAEIRRIRQDIARTKEHANRVERTTTPREPGVRRYAKKIARKALAREKKLDRYLASEERVEKPDQRWQMKLEIDPTTRGGQEVITLREVGHTYDGQHWLFRDANLSLRHGERIALLGPNGCGKSTLLRGIVGQLSLAAGQIRIGANIHIGYMPQEQETLDPAATPLSVVQCVSPLNETAARHFLHNFLFAGDEVFVPVRDLSYGERSRLLLAKLVLGGANCLVLDEPLNHLDIPSRERLEQALAAFPGAILITTHDRAFIDQFASAIWAITGGAIRQCLDRAAI